MDEVDLADRTDDWDTLLEDWTDRTDTSSVEPTLALELGLRSVPSLG